MRKIGYDVSDAFKGYLRERRADETLSVNLATRFMAIRSFETSFLSPPKGIAYTFIYMQFLVWERLAIAYPQECQVQLNNTAFHVRRLVNTDLRALRKADSPDANGNIDAEKVPLDSQRY